MFKSQTLSYVKRYFLQKLQQNIFLQLVKNETIQA